jgi:hypothetical protein
MDRSGKHGEHQRRIYVVKCRVSNVARTASPIGRNLKECRMKLSKDPLTHLGEWVSGSFDKTNSTFNM